MLPIYPNHASYQYKIARPCRTKTHSSETSPSYKETSLTKTSNLLYSLYKIFLIIYSLSQEHKKQITICKNFIETDSSIHERMGNFRALGTNKQVPSSSICEYNLLRQADTVPKSFYRPGKQTLPGAKTEIQKMYTIQKKGK